MSKMSAMNMKIGAETTCTGTSATSFAQCVISVHKDMNRWETLRQGGLDFIARTHNRTHLMHTWNNTIQSVLEEQRHRHVALSDLNSNTYATTTEHRSGWSYVIQYLANDAKILERLEGSSQREYAWTLIGEANAKSPENANLLFLDATESWFYEKRGPIDVPWVGITHFAANPPQFSSQKLGTTLRDADFIKSLPHCRGIVVLAEHMKTVVNRALLRNNITSTKVCSALHPITVEAEAVLYDPATDLSAAFLDGHGVILLGQQCRRYANFHLLETNGRPKFWLPGPDNKRDLESAVQRANEELKAEGVKKDSSIVVKYTESFEEYAQLVKQNIVVIDLWAATAVNAILEAIALNAPILVRRLPSTLEYLGRKYPLFFRDTEELQSMLADDHLKDMLLKGHLYLKGMDKSRFSLANFAKSVEECATK